MGNRRNASATVAMTAVQMANSICIESKKKNMTSNDIEAPSGRHIACIESNVWMPFDDFPSLLFDDEFSPSVSSLEPVSPEIQRNEYLFWNFWIHFFE